MAGTVIKIENISKQYRLGQVGTGSLAHDVNRWWHQLLGKEDPYLKVGETNDRTQKADSNYVWALKDISFSIEKGDVVGIIGRNGAGKSTLLKVLSRTTAPTTGSVKVKGRIASLLEVGTGFHPELTGRENIFLNGAILGMTRKEIQRKFDEIVDFAGVERYIDTPVKRYSSGMYVRLAFAVAAHLEPEILIVDEVLAVGDAEFQKKCLGKMKDVSEKDGRTVLFVSHNMGAVKQLCTKGVLLVNGKLAEQGNIERIIKEYHSVHYSQSNLTFVNQHPSETDILSVEICQSEEQRELYAEEAMIIRLQYKLHKSLKGGVVNFIVSNYEQNLFMSFDTDLDPHLLEDRQPGVYEFEITIPPFTLKPGKYSIGAGIGVASSHSICQHNSLLNFEMFSQSENYSFVSYREDRIGVIPKVLKWNLKQQTPIL